MKTANIQDIYELTPLQKGILFHSLYAPEIGLYFIQVRYQLSGELNPVAFETAWQQIVERHTALRTGFYWEDVARPLQVVYKQVKVPLQHHDWRSLEADKQQQQLASLLLRDRQQGFDLSQECLMRLFLLRITDHCYEFIWSKHHLIMDGWSLPVVLKEFVQTYEALCQGQVVSLTPSRPFRDYIDWWQQQDLSKAEVFWQQALRDCTKPTSLIRLEINNLSNQEEKYDEEQVTLSVASTNALQSLARQYQLTLNTLIQGAWAILLSRYSGQNSVIYGCTVSGRPVDLEEVESIVGVFINTLPIYVELAPAEFLLSWLQQLQAQLAETRQYEYAPLTDIQGWSNIPRGLPLFESIVVFENQPVTKFLQEWEGNIKVEESSLFYKTNYPLTIVAYPGSELTIAISYDFRRFDIATIRGILQDFALLLNRMIDKPQIRLQEISLLTQQQQSLISSLGREMTFDFDLIACN
jgi:hypothetical protein